MVSWVEMADLETTVAFKAPRWMVEKLSQMAGEQSRTVSNLVRMLLERQLVEEGKGE